MRLFNHVQNLLKGVLFFATDSVSSTFLASSFVNFAKDEKTNIIIVDRVVLEGLRGKYFINLSLFDTLGHVMEKVGLVLSKYEVNIEHSHIFFIGLNNIFLHLLLFFKA